MDKSLGTVAYAERRLDDFSVHGYARLHAVVHARRLGGDDDIPTPLAGEAIFTHPCIFIVAENH